jgi:catechol 2,3-dioxygenase-like lactoylglutathione lyase family enzyme
VSGPLTQLGCPSGAAEQAARTSIPNRVAQTARQLRVEDTAGMDVTGLGWSGTRTERAEELAAFYANVLGLALVHREPGLWVFRLPDGRNVEVFGPDYPGKDHFDTGPVVGFAVLDLRQAVEELRSAGVELLGEPGPTWQHFRGPDGNVYELVSS